MAEFLRVWRYRIPPSASKAPPNRIIEEGSGAAVSLKASENASKPELLPLTLPWFSVTSAVISKVVKAGFMFKVVVRLFAVDKARVVVNQVPPAVVQAPADVMTPVLPFPAHTSTAIEPVPPAPPPSSGKKTVNTIASTAAPEPPTPGLTLELMLSTTFAVLWLAVKLLTGS